MVTEGENPQGEKPETEATERPSNVKPEKSPLDLSKERPLVTMSEPFGGRWLSAGRVHCWRVQ